MCTLNGYRLLFIHRHVVLVAYAEIFAIRSCQTADPTTWKRHHFIMTTRLIRTRLAVTIVKAILNIAITILTFYHIDFHIFTLFLWFLIFCPAITLIDRILENHGRVTRELAHGFGRLGHPLCHVWINTSAKKFIVIFDYEIFRLITQ